MDKITSMEYIIRTVSPTEAPLLASPCWKDAAVLQIDNFRPESSSHRPLTAAQAVYDSDSLLVKFTVQDRYVRALRTGYQADVWKDSCVECFLQPREMMGYFNFEMNCGGSLLCNYIEDPRRVPGGFARFTPLPESLLRSVIVESTLAPIVDPEITGPIDWELAVRIPFAILEEYTGPIGDPAGKSWRGNFFKCADESTHPHWASWSPVGELNFHRPQDFGILVFEP